MARPDAGERIAERVRFLCGYFALLAQLADPHLHTRRVSSQLGELCACGFPIVGSLIGLVANADGRFEELMLARFMFAKRVEVVDQSFFRLLLFAVQAKKAFAGF